MLNQQLTKIATEGKARMPGSWMSVPSCFERMTAMDAARNEQFAFWLETGETPAIGQQTGALKFWRVSGQLPNPNIISFCLVHDTTFQQLAAVGLRAYFAWLTDRRAAFCVERGLSDVVFDDELASAFRTWLRVHALEAAQ